MQKFKTKISFIGIFWVLLLLLSYESIPSLPKNPTLTNKEDISSLIADEAELFIRNFFECLAFVCKSLC